MTYFGIITVRTASRRLNKKCLLKLGNKSIVEHNIQRCMYYNIKPIICTTLKSSDNILIKIANKYKIKYFRGSEKNKINRWYECAKKYRLKYFHTIDSDDPYFDPITIKQSLNECKKGYDIVFPSKVSKNGGASEGYSFSLKSISNLNKDIEINYKKINFLDTEMIEKFIDRKNFKIKHLEGAKYALKNLRLTLDYIEDYSMIKEIFAKLGSFSSRKKINNFLKRNKNLRKINHFRNVDWKKNQKRILKA